MIPWNGGGEFVRSRKNRAEKITNMTEETPIPSTVNPIVEENPTGEQNQERVNKSDDTFNYEISKRIRANHGNPWQSLADFP